MKRNFLTTLLGISLTLIILSGTTQAAPAMPIGPPPGSSGSSGGSTVSGPSGKISFTPLAYPPIPPYPTLNWSWGVTIPVIQYHIGFSVSIPDLAKLPSFFFSLVGFAIEYLAVGIFNLGLYIIQAVYSAILQTEEAIVNAVINVALMAGVFAVPVLILIVGLIGIAIYAMINAAQDATLILGAG